MGLRDLLVYVDQTESAFSRLRLAADLASRHNSRLTVSLFPGMEPGSVGGARHGRARPCLGQGT